MAVAVSVEDNIELEIKKSVSLSSKLVVPEEEATVTAKVLLAEAGPSSIHHPTSTKRKLEFSQEIPRYRRGYLWSDVPHNSVSPSALYTETAPPLPSPPQHLLNDPIIQASLLGAKHQIKVETPFNVDRLEAMLFDHPNQPFVKSVMTGLREGFWPLDDGDWSLEVEDQPPKNFISEDDDLEALRTYRDKEVLAGRWSGPLPTLLPGMKVSPMFVVWQKEKARVITDHSSSGLNDGIPRAGHQENPPWAILFNCLSLV